MGIVSVSMPAGLLEELDDIAETHDYSGRSEVFREAGRKLVREFREPSLAGRDLVAVVVVLFPYESPAIEATMAQLRHTHSEAVRSASHSCVYDDRGCVETFVLEGDIETVSTFVRDVESAHEDVRTEHTLVPAESFRRPGL